MCSGPPRRGSEEPNRIDADATGLVMASIHGIAPHPYARSNTLTDASAMVRICWLPIINARGNVLILLDAMPTLAICPPRLRQIPPHSCL